MRPSRRRTSEAAEPRPLPSGDTAELIEHARRELEALVGTAPESVSGIDYRDGRWTVLLEVVEVARIPNTTDVLATYELTLDDERRVIGVTRTRRYRRSQVDE